MTAHAPEREARDAIECESKRIPRMQTKTQFFSSLAVLTVMREKEISSALYEDVYSFS
jgi:hypothetical protein